MDLEWAKDGNTGELFIVQARPETVQSRKNPDVLETYRLGQRSAVLVSGRSVGEKIATGRVRVIQSAQLIGGSVGFPKRSRLRATDKNDGRDGGVGQCVDGGGVGCALFFESSQRTEARAACRVGAQKLIPRFGETHQAERVAGWCGIENDVFEIGVLRAGEERGEFIKGRDLHRA
jgi:hypothetical protein